MNFENSFELSDNEVIFQVLRLCSGEEHFDTSEYQQCAEEDYDPMILHEDRTHRDKQRSKEKGAENSPEKDSMLVSFRDSEIREDDGKKKDVVDCFILFYS